MQRFHDFPGRRCWSTLLILLAMLITSCAPSGSSRFYDDMGRNGEPTWKADSYSGTAMAKAYFKIFNLLYIDYKDLKYISVSIDGQFTMGQEEFLVMVKQFCDERKIMMLMQNSDELLENGYLSDQYEFSSGYIFSLYSIELYFDKMVIYASRWRSTPDSSAYVYSLEYDGDEWEITGTQVK